MLPARSARYLSTVLAFLVFASTDASAGATSSSYAVKQVYSNGLALEPKVGEMLRVSLPEHLSHGYEWRIALLPPTLVLVDDRNVIPRSGQFLGRRGFRIFYLKRTNLFTDEVQSAVFELVLRSNGSVVDRREMNFFAPR